MIDETAARISRHELAHEGHRHMARSWRSGGGVTHCHSGHSSKINAVSRRLGRVYRALRWAVHSRSAKRLNSSRKVAHRVAAERDPELAGGERATKRAAPA